MEPHIIQENGVLFRFVQGDQLSYDDLTKTVFCDKIVTTEDGGKFPVSSFLLSGASEFFSTWFCSEYIIQGREAICIPGISASTMRTILQYGSTHEIGLTDENFYRVILAADYLLMPELVEKCIAHAKANISAQNCVCLYLTFHLMGKQEIMDASYRYILDNFERVSMEMNFDKLTLHCLMRLLQEGVINTCSQWTVREAIRRWLLGNKEAILESSAQFLPLLRKDFPKNGTSVEDTIQVVPYATRKTGYTGLNYIGQVLQDTLVVFKSKPSSSNQPPVCKDGNSLSGQELRQNIPRLFGEVLFKFLCRFHH